MGGKIVHKYFNSTIKFFAVSNISPSVGIVPTPLDKSLIGRAFQSAGGKGYIITELKDNCDKVHCIYIVCFHCRVRMLSFCMHVMCEQLTYVLTLTMGKAQGDAL